MHQDIPKQILTIKDKPIIVYTLEAFQKHPNVDNIVLVCLEGWQDIARDANQFAITKLKAITVGGVTGQQSIRYGLEAAKEFSKDDDIILIHDDIRPMVSQDIITDAIVTCQKYGNGIPVIPLQ